jgi:hypothetical protein
MAAILFLTIDAIPNHVYWNQWRGENMQIRFYVNAKNSRMITPKGFVRLPKDYEVSNTLWGHHSLVLAHQALLRFALMDFPEAEWFLLVSSDALPLKPVKTLFGQLKPNQSLVDEFTETETIQQWGTMNEALQRWGANEEENWWVDTAATKGEDGEGEFRVLDETKCCCAGQFHVLCRDHAKDIANMPERVARDFDALIAVVGGVRNSLAADEIVPFGYLNHLGKGHNIHATRFMHADLDSKDPRHAASHKALIDCPHLFGRKYPGVI